ncbi:MAG: hypothetical protein ABI185_07570 [Ginsengibacter sp.]
MSKKVLAIYYSQTGQLRDIIDNFCAPLIENGIAVEKVKVTLKNEYAFPWTVNSFFNVMPDCVLGKTAELSHFELKESSYDLIILGYQPWFLSPSIPVNSLLHDPIFRKVLKNTPVITITCARNMWINAYKEVEKLLVETGSIQVGNIALVDRHLNVLSFVTIFHWMIHGKKDKYLNVFPKPGVSDEDIANVSVFGKKALPHLVNGNWEGMEAELLEKNAVDLKYHLMFIESKAGPMFKLWAKFIVKRKNKSFWIAVYKYYLIIAFFVAAPIVYVIDIILFKPFFSKYVRSKKQSLLKLN